MKLNTLILSLGLGLPLLLSNTAIAQNADASSSDKKVEQLEQQLADEKDKRAVQNNEQTTGDLKDLKRAHKEAKRKSKEDMKFA